jgi:hypothetical protein
VQEDSNFARYAFKGFRFAPIPLRGTASPPLSALAALLCHRHVGSGGMSDFRLTRGINVERQRAARFRAALLTCAVIGSSACTAFSCLSLTAHLSKHHLTCWKYLPGGLGGGEHPQEATAISCPFPAEVQKPHQNAPEMPIGAHTIYQAWDLA